MATLLKELAIGIDIGGTNISMAFVDKNGTISYKKKILQKAIKTLIVFCKMLICSCILLYKI